MNIGFLNNQKISPNLASTVNFCTHWQKIDQDSLVVKCRNDSHSPGPVIREISPGNDIYTNRSIPSHTSPDDTDKIDI